MGWKKNEDGSVAAKDGNPVWVNANGEEVAVDYERLHTFGKTAADARDEFKKNLSATTKELEEIRRKYGDLDPDEARAALKIASALGEDEKDVRKVLGELESLRAEKEAFQTQLDERDTALKNEKARLKQAMVRSGLAGSKFLRERLIDIPLGHWEFEFGKFFEVEADDNDVRLTPNGRDGKKLYSSKRPGEVMSVDEALEHLVSTHPERDRFLKSDGAGGSGHPGETGSHESGSPYVLSRERAKDPAAYRAAKEAADKAGVPLRISAS